MPENVQCVECGYLTLRVKQPSGTLAMGDLVEVDDSYRQRYRLGLGTPQPMPLCFMRERNFQWEWDEVRFKASQTTNPDQLALFSALLTERITCAEYADWQQGFSPKEHREMVDRNKLLQRDHQWHQDDLTIQRETVRYAKQAALAQGLSAAVAAIAIVVGVVVALAISAKDDSPQAVYFVTPVPQIGQVTPTPELPR